MALSDGEKEALLQAFFKERLSPLAELARARQISFFPLGPDKAAASYYEDRNDDGNYVFEIDATDLEGELRKMWSDDKLPELAELAEGLVELAAILHKEEAETEGEVSPFIYAMF
jgi:hypothetical protein